MRAPRIPAFVFAVALGNLLVPLNSTMIVVALPLIGRDLGADPVTLAWLVTSYLIAVASLEPLAGLALFMAWRSLPAGDAPRRSAHPDIRGAVALGVLLSLAAWTLTEAGTSAPAVTIGLLVVVALAAVAFVRYESRHADPAL